MFFASATAVHKVSLANFNNKYELRSRGWSKTDSSPSYKRRKSNFFQGMDHWVEMYQEETDSRMLHCLGYLVMALN